MKGRITDAERQLRMRNTPVDFDLYNVNGAIAGPINAMTWLKAQGFNGKDLAEKLKSCKVTDANRSRG